MDISSQQPAASSQQPAASGRRNACFNIGLIPVTIGGILGFIFYGAALAKVHRPDETLESIAHVFGQAAAMPMLVALLIVEIILGAMLLTGTLLRHALITSLVLSAAFLGWTCYLWLTNAPVGCGCGVPALFEVAATNRSFTAGLSGGMLLVSTSAVLIMHRFDRTERQSGGQSV